MNVIIDKQEFEDGAFIIHKRGDVSTDYWHCRVKVPGQNRYKTKCLKTSDLKEARKTAYRFYLDIENKVENKIPIYSKTFKEVTKEYCEIQDRRAAVNEITQKSANVNKDHVKSWINQYIGKKQVSSFKEEHFFEYVEWRKLQKPKRGNKPVSDGTIRSELTTFKAILRLGAKKGLVNPLQLPTGKMPVNAGAREEFTEAEFSTLTKFLKDRMGQGSSDRKNWYRAMLYHYVAIMVDTGMRPGEARRLKLSDFKEGGGKKEVATCLTTIIGKRKNGERQRRVVPAPARVYLHYLAIKMLRPEGLDHDFLFIDFKGKQSNNMYADLIRQVLKDTKLKKSASGSERSAYCFRHTFATVNGGVNSDH
ncbi:MAG: site-specific integrase [Rhodospirillaceae bacterium]|nr:site-specific integrase [Rhodospirillaceae bacterium]